MALMLGSGGVAKLCVGPAEATRAYLGATEVYAADGGSVHGPTLWDPETSGASVHPAIVNGGRDVGPINGIAYALPVLPYGKIYFEMEQVTAPALWNSTAHVGVAAFGQSSLAQTAVDIANGGGFSIRLDQGHVYYSIGQGHER
jgi:hypothetical protein